MALKDKQNSFTCEIATDVSIIEQKKWGAATDPWSELQSGAFNAACLSQSRIKYKKKSPNVS